MELVRCMHDPHPAAPCGRPCAHCLHSSVLHERAVPCRRSTQSCEELRHAAGYALSIFIPVSPVCVLPYEAVRWALIGVATLTSGLFLLLNFRGPIFDVAGAKCAPLLAGDSET